MKPRRTAIQRTHRVLLLVLAVLFIVLVATGIWLSFRYQPSGRFIGAHHESWVRVAHRTTSRVFVATALATFGLSIAVSYERALKRGVPAWIVGAVLIIVALAASFSGFLLPWDELALAGVRANFQYRGFGFLFRGSFVRFVLIGSTEVAKNTVRLWFLAHALGAPIVLVGVGVAGWRATRRTRLLPAPSPAGKETEPPGAL